MSGSSVTTVSCQKLPPTSVSRSGLDDADPDQAELRVGAARRRPACRRARPVSSAARPRHRPDDRARARGPRGRSPVEADQVERAPATTSGSARSNRFGARARRRVGDEPPGQPVEDPVAEHADVGDRARTSRARASRIQQEPGGRGDRRPSRRRSRRSAGRRRSGRARRPASPARESTFGQAQISRPAGVVQDHALAHARAAHGRRSSRGLPAGRSSASRMQSQISRQFRAVSKTCEPGTPGSAACDHSRCPIATCRPSSSKRTARQLPVPRSMASRWAHQAARPGRAARPAPSRLATLTQRLAGERSRSISAAAISPPWCRVSWVAPPMCGVMIDVREREQRMAPACRRWADDVERRTGQPARRRARRRAPPRRRASSRAVLTRYAPGLHARRSRRRRCSPRLSAVARAWSDTKSDRAEERRQVDRLDAGRLDRRRVDERVEHERPACRTRARAAATRRPTWPKPTRPRVWPARSWPNQRGALVVVVAELAARPRRAGSPRAAGGRA